MCYSVLIKIDSKHLKSLMKIQAANQKSKTFSNVCDCQKKSKTLAKKTIG
jgi:hypothetical protein